MDSEPQGGMGAVLPAVVAALFALLVTGGLALVVIVPAALVGLRRGRGPWWWASVGGLMAAVAALPWVWRQRG